MLLIGLTSLLIAAPLYSVTITPTLLTRITSIIFLFSATLSFNSLYMQAINSGIGLYSGLFQVTTVTQFMEIFIYVIAACILLGYAPQVLSDTLTFPDQKKEKTQIIAEYPLILLFTIIGASFLISSADLISMYLSIELQSFAVYILASVYRDSESATSAGLKYFLLGALSSALILLGSSLIYAYTGLTNFEGISMISNSQIGAFAGTDDFSKGVVLGILIIGVGFLFKVAAAPFHSWAPDVYDGVPTIVTTWLTIMPKISLFIFLLAFIFPFFSSALMGEVKYMLLATSLLSLVIGTVVGLAQSRIKRLLAFSTISHVGFLLLALSVNSENSITSFLFYLMQYSITNLNTFFVILAFGYVLQWEPGYNDKQSTIANDVQENLSQSPPWPATSPGAKAVYPFPDQGKGYTATFSLGNDKDITLISQLKGQFSANPLLGLSFAVCLFSMAGIPPLLGFFAKYLVLYSAIESGYYFLALIGILASVVSAAYYLRIIRVIHFDLGSSFIRSAALISSVPAPQIKRSLISSTVFSSQSKIENGNPGSGSPYNQDSQESLSYTSRKSDALISKENPSLTSAHSYVIAVLTLSILFFILSPSLFLNSCNLLALSLFTA